MQFNIKSGLGEKKHSKAEIIASLGKFWNKIHIYLFFAFLIAVMVFGWIIWQKSFSGSGWSEDKKQEYLSTQSKGIALNENDYKKVIADIETRRKSNIEGQQNLRDIFFDASN